VESWNEGYEYPPQYVVSGNMFNSWPLVKGTMTNHFHVVNVWIFLDIVNGRPVWLEIGFDRGSRRNCWTTFTDLPRRYHVPVNSKVEMRGTQVTTTGYTYG